MDKENKDSKTLKTLALGWFFKKRAFHVSRKFKPLLAYLIKTKHNSNRKAQQTTLKGEIIQEYTYYILGFVSTHVVRLKNEEWFIKLNYEQMTSVERFLDSMGVFNQYLKF